MFPSGTTMFQRTVERKKNDGVGFTHDEDHGGLLCQRESIGCDVDLDGEFKDLAHQSKLPENHTPDDSCVIKLAF